MSEFKSGDKVLAEVYIIGAARVQGEERYIVTDNDKYAAETLAIKKDKAHTIPTKTYEDGLREAWEMAKKLICNIRDGGFSATQLQEIFGFNNFYNVFINYTAAEAAAKIAEWEARQNIQVRDQVRYGDTNNLGVVMKVVGQDDDIGYYVWWDSGSSSYERADDLTKTGRTIDIAGLLEQIGGVEDVQ